MRLRVFGYSFDKDGLPPALTRTALFESLSQTGERALRNGTFQIAATEVSHGLGAKAEKWWGGILLKVRDARGFNKLIRDQDGKRKVTAEKLKANEEIAEVNFFIAHPVTGSGLYAHYHQSASLVSDFRWVCYKTFDEHRKECRNAALAADGLSNSEQKAIRARYQGTLSLNQLVRSEQLKALVKTLKKVNSVTVKVVMVQTNERLFRGIQQQASSRSVKFTFPSDQSVARLADDVGDVSGSDQIQALSVSGITPSGRERTLNLNKNPFVFEEWDYDEAMGNMELDLDDWEDSIASAPVIKRLIEVAKDVKVRQLLDAS